jgi:hypothetical protein
MLMITMTGFLNFPDFTTGGAEEYSSRTITASLYLLVREADVSPMTFVCTDSGPKLGIKPFDGSNPEHKKYEELWDFGPEPHKHVSYSFHNPYSSFPARPKLPSDFALAADMSPWFKEGDIIRPGNDRRPPQIISIAEGQKTWRVGNSQNHIGVSRKEGQYIVFADGHASYEEEPNVGVNGDNIYTFWSTTDNPTEQDIQGGTNPTSRSKENDAKSKDDSFLAI